MKQRPVGIFWIAVGYYLCASVIPDKRAFLFLGAAAVYLLYRATSRLPAAILIGYFLQIPITVGKKWIVDLVPPATLALPGRPFGISADFLLTMTDVMTAVMGVSVLLSLGSARVRNAARGPLFISLALLPASMLVSTFMGSVYPSVSVFHVWQFVKPLITYLFIACYGDESVRDGVYAVLAAACIFEMGLVAAQTVRGSTLGLAIEEFPQYTPIDYSADAGTYGITRTGGTFGHANNLAHALSFIVPLLLPLLVSTGTIVRNFVPAGWGTIAGLAGLVLTRSRSAWIGTGVAVLIYAYVAERMWRVSLRSVLRIDALAAKVLAVTAILAVVVVFFRSASTFSTFAQYGSGQTRIELLQASLPVIEDRWIFGVGLEMDAYYLYTRSQAVLFAGRAKQSVLAYFPEPPHNGFLRLLLQAGVVGTVPYCIALYGIGVGVYRHMMRRAPRARIGHLAVLVAIVSYLMNSMFQPLLPDLQMILAASMILGHRRGEFSA